MRNLTRGVSFAVAMAGIFSVSAGAAQRQQREAAGLVRPNPSLPWCETTGGWPPNCKPSHPLGSVLANPRAADGVAHYEIVRFVLSRLVAVPRERRTAETARSLETEYLTSRRVRFSREMLTLPPVGDDPTAMLRRMRASTRLVAGLNRAIELARQLEPIRDFERDLGELNQVAATNLSGGEQTAFYEFTATLAEGYRFWTPRSEGGSGGVELLLAVRGQGEPLLPPRDQPEAMRVFWRNFIRYACIDALSSLAGLAGGPAGAVVAGATGTLTVAVGEMAVGGP